MEDQDEDETKIALDTAIKNKTNEMSNLAMRQALFHMRIVTIITSATSTQMHSIYGRNVSSIQLMEQQTKRKFKSLELNEQLMEDEDAEQDEDEDTQVINNTPLKVLSRISLKLKKFPPMKKRMEDTPSPLKPATILSLLMKAQPHLPLHQAMNKKVLLQDGQLRLMNDRSLVDLAITRYLQLVQSCIKFVKETLLQMNTHMCLAIKNISQRKKFSFHQSINKNVIIYTTKDARTSVFPGKVKNLVIIPPSFPNPYTLNTHITLLL